MREERPFYTYEIGLLCDLRVKCGAGRGVLSVLALPTWFFRRIANKFTELYVNHSPEEQFSLRLLFCLQSKGTRKMMVGNCHLVRNGRRSMTNPFGPYRFVDLATGQTYLVSPRDKRFVFQPSVISLTTRCPDWIHSGAIAGSASRVFPSKDAKAAKMRFPFAIASLP